MLTPTEKITLMRQAETNPGAAFLNLLGILRDEMVSMVEEKMKTIEASLPERVLLKHVEKLKGEKGDSPVIDVNKIKKDVFGSLMPLIPKAPNPIKPTKEELLSIITPLIPQVKNGEKPTENELRKIIQPLIPTPQKPIDEEELKGLIISLMPTLEEKGEKEEDDSIVQKISILEQEIEMLKKLPRTKDKRGKYLHGGSRTLVAGSNMTIVENGDGSTTFTSNGGSATIYTETPTGTINGSNTSYTTAHTITTVIGMWINGQFVHPSEYTVSGAGFTMGTALDISLAGASFTISYT